MRLKKRRGATMGDSVETNGLLDLNLFACCEGDTHNTARSRKSKRTIRPVTANSLFTSRTNFFLAPSVILLQERAYVCAGGTPWETTLAGNTGRIPSLNAKCLVQFLEIC